MTCLNFVSLLGCLAIASLWILAEGYMVGDNPYHQRAHLGPKGEYVLEWLVNQKENRIVFNVTVKTQGYVGFGLSASGKMSGADIVIGGVKTGGKTYFSDRHAVGNQKPELDSSQDWTLLGAWESSIETSLSFSRALDTCDPLDYPITEDKISVIWAFGEKDNAEGSYHHGNRGFYEVYLLHPDYSPPLTQHTAEQLTDLETKNLKMWTVNSVMQLPAQDTSYWCTMHKAPVLPGKHHVVGLDVQLDGPGTQHSHHLLLHKCKAPPGRSARAMFHSYLSSRGQECLRIKFPQGPMPTEYCTEFYQSWAVGGRPMFHPPHVGVPLGIERDEYYLLQVHYDNPDILSGVQVNVSLNMYYTSELRRHDAGLMWFRHSTPDEPPSLLVPPSSIDHQIYGFCGSDCTRRMLPQEGIHMYAMLLHSHNAGRQIRLQQFRDRRELPWVLSDENYAFRYQQWRVLTKEAQVFPGDLLAARCIYDSTAGNGSTVVGGFSSRQEMCVAFAYYYNKIPNYMQCNSAIHSAAARDQILGVQNITWSNEQLEWIVESPEHLAGLKISQVSNNHVEWTANRRETLQRFQLRHPQINECPLELYAAQSIEEINSIGKSSDLKTSYPYQATPYMPEKSCSFV